MDLEAEVKPPSSTEESTVRPGVDEEEQFKGEDVAHLKSKKRSDSDDEDEDAPAPYTTYDPQEEKTEEKKDSPEGVDDGGASSRGLPGREGHPNEELRAAQNEPSVNTEVETPAVENQNQNPGSSLQFQDQEEQPKLIPESSLGFSYQDPVLLTQHNNGVSLMTDEEHIQQQPQQQQQQQPQQHRSKLVGSGSGSESDASSRPFNAAATSINSPTSPTSLSRISSPERKLTLSEMTRITPEDESRLNLKPQQQPPVANPSPITIAASSAAVLSQVDPSTPISSLGSPSTVSNLTPDLTNSPSSPDMSNIPSSVSTSSAENSQGAAPAVSSTSSSSSSKFSFLSKGKGKHKKQDKLSKSPGSGSSGKSSKNQKKSKYKNAVSASANAPTEQKNSQSSQSSQGSTWVPVPLSSASSSSPMIQSLKVGGSSSQQPLTNSQESFVDGFSPELSDHSNEMDTSPQEAQILSAGYSLGMQVSLDAKNNCVVVKSVSSSGAVGRNGRIRVGDKIEAVNGESVGDLSLAKVKQILKRAAKANEFTITYTPSLMAASPHFSLSPQSNPPATAAPAATVASSATKDSSPGYNKASTAKASTLESKKSGGEERGSSSKEGTAMGGSSKSKTEVYYSQLPSVVASLHEQEASHQAPAPGGPSIPMHAPQGGGASGGGVLSGGHMMQPPPPPPSQPGAAMGSWMDGGGVTPYHQMQGYYGARTIEDQLGKPPPPYMFPHHQGQPGTAGRMMGGQSPYNHMTVGSQGPTHTATGMSWQLPHPQGMYVYKLFRTVNFF